MVTSWNSKLDRLKPLSLKNFQHGLIQDGDVSKAREEPLMPGDNGLYISGTSACMPQPSRSRHRHMW